MVPWQVDLLDIRRIFCCIKTERDPLMVRGQMGTDVVAVLARPIWMTDA